MRWGITWSFLVAGICSVVWGCSKEPAREIVTGRVTYQGKPVVGAGIRFYEARIGYGLVANLNANGEFETPTALPVGAYQVSITGAQPGGPQVPDAPPPSPVAPDFVHEAFREGATSGLEARVTTTETSFNYDITEPPKKKPGSKKPVLTRMEPEKPTK